MLKKQRDFLRLRHAKEHNDGVRKNPLFIKVPPKPWLIALGIIGILGAIIGSIIGATYLPWFQLADVTVTGTTTIDPSTITNDIQANLSHFGYPLFAKNNVFLIRHNLVIKKLITDFSLDSASITREGKSLTIVVKEKVMTVALRTKEKTMFLNLDGSFARDASPEESHAIDIRLGVIARATDEVLVPLQPDMPIILDTQTDPATSLPQESVDHILAITSALQNNAILTKTFSLDGANAPFTRVDTTQPFDLYFDLNRPIADQITALTALQSSPSAPAPTDYVDLRFGAYVYVK